MSTGDDRPMEIRRVTSASSAAQRDAAAEAGRHDADAPRVAATAIISPETPPGRRQTMQSALTRVQAPSHSPR